MISELVSIGDNYSTATANFFAVCKVFDLQIPFGFCETTAHDDLINAGKKTTVALKHYLHKLVDNGARFAIIMDESPDVRSQKPVVFFIKDLTDDDAAPIYIEVNFVNETGSENASSVVMIQLLHDLLTFYSIPSSSIWAIVCDGVSYNKKMWNDLDPILYRNAHGVWCSSHMLSLCVKDIVKNRSDMVKFLSKLNRHFRNSAGRKVECENVVGSRFPTYCKTRWTSWITSYNWCKENKNSLLAYIKSTKKKSLASLSKAFYKGSTSLNPVLELLNEHVVKSQSNNYSVLDWYFNFMLF